MKRKHQEEKKEEKKRPVFKDKEKLIQEAIAVSITKDEKPAKRVWRGPQAQPDPPMRGQKPPPPNGQDNCLVNLTFVLTGVLDSLTRDEAKSLIEKYGGRVTTSLSKKTNYLVKGNLEPGESKLKKAGELGTLIMDEDGLFELIRTRETQERPAAKKPKKSAVETKKNDKIKDKKQELDENDDNAFSKLTKARALLKKKTTVNTPPTVDTSTWMWVDRYAPTSLDHLLGNQFLVKGLIRWLKAWPENGPESKADTRLKCHLISGPPGTGKTSAVRLIAQAAGFVVVEFNASDVRNAKLIRERVYPLTSVPAVIDRFHRHKTLQTGQSDGRKERRLLVMDEIDGMAGNEDRGGLQAFIQSIKATRIPIIAIANDVTIPRMRTLKNYVTSHTWKRPLFDEVIVRLQEICRVEELTISKSSIQRIFELANGDLRHTLHFLQMMYHTPEDVTVSTHSESIKTTDLVPFEAAGRLFLRPPVKSPSWMTERTEHYFVDTMMVPLIVQENYIRCKPIRVEAKQTAGTNTKTKKSTNHSQDPDLYLMDRLSDAADLISDGDLVNQHMWQSRGVGFELQPFHALLSSVLPGRMVAGETRRMEFPMFLGKYSTKTKNERLNKELKQVLSAKQASTGRRDWTTSYLPLLRERLVRPLIRDQKEGIIPVMKLMDEYGMIREDWTVLSEMGERVMTIKSKEVHGTVKSAFTREYNKHTHSIAVSHGLTSKKAKVGTSSAKGIKHVENVEQVHSAIEDEEEDPEAETEKTDPTD